MFHLCKPFWNDFCFKTCSKQLTQSWFAAFRYSDHLVCIDLWAFSDFLRVQSIVERIFSLPKWFTKPPFTSFSNPRRVKNRINSYNFYPGRFTKPSFTFLNHPQRAPNRVENNFTHQSRFTKPSFTLFFHPIIVAWDGFRLLQFRNQFIFKIEICFK